MDVLDLGIQIGLPPFPAFPIDVPPLPMAENRLSAILQNRIRNEDGFQVKTVGEGPVQPLELLLVVLIFLHVVGSGSRPFSLVQFFHLCRSSFVGIGRL